MPFLDKVFRWKKKPFKGAEVIKDSKKESKSQTASKDGGASVQGSGRYAHVLARPHISEKSAMLQEMRQYVFEVTPSVTKNDVSVAVADLYGITPCAVNMIRMHSKQIRFGRTEGSTRAWKKAIVTLPEGKSIDIYKK